jgi:hypothetical protein
MVELDGDPARFGETVDINPHDFGTGLTIFETQNNMMWLPSVVNVPLLLNLSLTSRPVAG